MNWPRIHWFELHEKDWFPKFLKYQIGFILNILWTIDFPEYITTNFPQVHKIFKPRYISVSERIGKALETLTEYHPNEEIAVMDMCSGGSGPNDIISRYVNKLLKDKVGKPIKFYLSDLYPNIEVWKEVCSNNPYLSYIESPVDIIKPFKLVQADKVFQTFYLCYHHFTDGQVRKILKNSFESSDGFAIVELTERSIFSVINTAIVSGILFPLFVVPFYFRSLPISIYFTIYVFPILIFTMSWDSLVSTLRTRSNEELMEFIKEFDIEGWEFEFGSDTIMYPLEKSHWLIAIKKPSNNV